MKNAGKKSILGSVSIFFLAILLMPVVSGFSANPIAEEVTCPAPGVSKTGQTSTTISFSWDAVEGATGYRMWYVRQGDNYTSPESTTSSTSVTYTDLPPGNYRFYFQTICGAESSSYVMIDDLLM